MFHIGSSQYSVSRETIIPKYGDNINLFHNNAFNV